MLLGEIDEANTTFSVMGNSNEYGVREESGTFPHEDILPQVVIGETTHGGLSILSNVGKDYRNGTVIDYGSLIWLTLQRSKTAREAIETMVMLCDTYGYASAMEGFSIADGDEVWYMELLGRGNLGTGVLYVALRIPDGYVAAHANQARIREFLPCDDPDWCRCSADVVDFATAHGFYDPEIDGTFSFSDVFDPVRRAFYPKFLWTAPDRRSPSRELASARHASGAFFQAFPMNLTANTMKLTRRETTSADECRSGLSQLGISAAPTFTNSCLTILKDPGSIRASTSAPVPSILPIAGIV